MGVDVFLERFQTRLYVGKLEKKEENFCFTYDHSYLKAKNVFPLGPEFPLTQVEFLSKNLFPSFADRLPDPENPSYTDYCAAAGITASVSDPLILLATIGKRGPSSFIFEPIYKESFTYEDCEKFREQLGLSMQDFAHLFDVSLSVLQKIKAGETSGHEVLKRLEQYINFPESLDFQIKRNAKWLHSKKQITIIPKEQTIILHYLQNIFFILNDENNRFSLDEAVNLEKNINICYSILAKTTFQSVSSKDFKSDQKRFLYEIKPMIAIANYLHSTGNDLAAIAFCSDKSELKYDGVFYWKGGEKTHLELTRAIGGREGGKNESLAKQLLEERGMAPFNQKINYTRNKREINFEFNAPSIHVDLHKTHIPARLKLALKEKLEKIRKSQDSQKYQDYWLIITVPLYWPEDTFHEVCARFWKSAYEMKIPFKRIFVVTEEFIRIIDDLPKWTKKINLEGFEQIKKGNLEDSVWDSWSNEHKIYFLLRLQNIEFHSKNGQELYDLLLKTSDDIVLKNLDDIARWLLQISQNIEQDSESKFLELFDRVVRCAFKIRIPERRSDPINGAFNHPVGDLTRSILFLLDKNLRTTNQISQDIRVRLTNLVEDRNPNQLMSLIVAFSEIQWLFQINKEWVKDHLLKYFQYKQRNQNSYHVWKAFITGIYSKNPTVPYDLFCEIKQDFIKTIRYLNKISSYQELCYVLMYLFFCEEGYFDKEDLSQKFLSSLDTKALEHISFAIFQLLNSVGEQSHELWKSKINNWLRTSWPKGKQFVNSTISDYFVMAAIKSGNAFDEALKTLSVLDLLKISQNLFYLLRELLCSEIPSKFPDETTELLIKICPDSFQSVSSILSGKEKLQDILWIIRNAKPKISNNQVYKKLLSASA